MIEKILDVIRFHDEKEDYETVIGTIEKGVEFRGTNLWVLVFAIFVASLGLNLNSTAVIIGAMLISPLMGPIMGIGLSVAINDLPLLKKSARNFAYAVLAGLITSTIYFSISPLSDAYSELLARTTPTIYDVLIAFMGGMAAIVATSSRNKGNVIAGAAIATALMPPLCTAGYGIASMKPGFIFGALYLFTINAVFIGLATLITTRILKFPVKHLPDSAKERKNRRIIFAVIIITLAPSIYSGYLMIQENRFVTKAGRFAEAYLTFEGSYQLNKIIDPRKETITLIFGGKDISPEQIASMKEKLHIFGLDNAKLEVKQGLSLSEKDKESARIVQLTRTIQEKDALITGLRADAESYRLNETLSKQILGEMKALYPAVKSISVNRGKEYESEKETASDIVIINDGRKLNGNDREKIKTWLSKRLESGNVSIFFY